ncbi:MAG: hypothetical protein A2Y25_05830 [Candidatus Melainabacteria bacterium GWF2_37_15]|nr:MAG: hypothetical protein A2Y25_05830 [Candidatus Melainabacteria bacterium GWF2_37_15]
MKKLLTGALLTIALSFSIQSANAAVITFDSPAVEYDRIIQNGDYGFNWQSMYILNPDADPYFSGTGYDIGRISEKNVAYSNTNAYMYAIGDSTFTLNNAWFTSAWQETDTLTVTAYLDGVFRGSKTVGLTNTAPLLVEFNFTNIDEVVFHADINQFVMDNLVYNEGMGTPVPEPSSILLGLMGASSLLGLKKKKSA